MVAISLYRGNLHRVPTEIPRRLQLPTRKISPKDFKTLLNRRNKALYGDKLTSLQNRPLINHESANPKPSEQEPEKINEPIVRPKPETQLEELKDAQLEELKEDCVVKEEKDIEEPNCVDKPIDKDEKVEVAEKMVDDELIDGKQASQKVEELEAKEKKKREMEEKHKSLTAKKHNLVQALKQILKAEEEIKRRSVQGLTTRPPVLLQVDTTNDSGLMTRHATTPRTGSEANVGGDMEGVEMEDASNQNVQSRHPLRMSSMSPSSESPLRRPTYLQHNVVSYPSRSSLVITGSPSPSRFAPTTHQGHPGNPPAVSISGTNYVASSPSPAASGGTSVFREARQPSPWN